MLINRNQLITFNILPTYITMYFMSTDILYFKHQPITIRTLNNVPFNSLLLAYEITKNHSAEIVFTFLKRSVLLAGFAMY